MKHMPELLPLPCRYLPQYRRGDMMDSTSGPPSGFEAEPGTQLASLVVPTNLLLGSLALLSQA